MFSFEEFLKDPLGFRARESDQTVQVVVPKVVPPPPLPRPVQAAATDGVPAGDAVLDEAVSTQAKRVALQRKGAAAMIAAEEYARRFESGDVVVSKVSVIDIFDLLVYSWVCVVGFGFL